MTEFKGRHFRGEIVLWAVRWYRRYAASYRDLEAMMTERGVVVDHYTIYRWVQRFASEMEKRLRWQWRRPRSASWRIDETYGQGTRQVGVPVPRARQAHEHDRLLPLGDAQHQGGEAIPRQGAERIEGVGAARGGQHRPGADQRRGHRAAQGRGAMSAPHEAPPSETPQQRGRSRPRQAQAVDRTGPRIQVSVDGLRHEQGFRGDADVARGSGWGVRPRRWHRQRSQARRVRHRRWRVHNRDLNLKPTPSGCTRPFAAFATEPARLRKADLEFCIPMSTSEASPESPTRPDARMWLGRLFPSATLHRESNHGVVNFSPASLQFVAGT